MDEMWNIVLYNNDGMFLPLYSVYTTSGAQLFDKKYIKGSQWVLLVHSYGNKASLAQTYFPSRQS